MRFHAEKLTILRFFYATLLIAISAALFVFLIEALNVFVKVRRGMASWAATMAMLVAGIAELGFIIYSGESFRRFKSSGAITYRFFVLLMVLGWLFVLLGVFKLWTFAPDLRLWITYAPAFWDNTDYVLTLCGLIVGVGSTIFLMSRWMTKKSSHR